MESGAVLNVKHRMAKVGPEGLYGTYDSVAQVPPLSPRGSSGTKPAPAALVRHSPRAEPMPGAIAHGCGDGVVRFAPPCFWKALARPSKRFDPAAGRFPGNSFDATARS